MTQFHDVIVVGAGIFGVMAALELSGRGYKVTVLDPGPLPQPLAASTDISKAVRMEYGADEQYTAMVEASLPGWRRWNDELGEPLFHEVGVTMITRAPMAPGGFEYESYHLLRRHKHTPERLDADEIRRRFPAWKPDTYVDGFFHECGGYVESGRLLAALINQGRRDGIDFSAGQAVAALLGDRHRVTGVRLPNGDQIEAAKVVVAAGTWTHLLIPELKPVMRSVGQPVFHLRPVDTELYRPPFFTVFGADVSQTGWYGFPLHPREGVVKMANHGVGRRLHPVDDPRELTADDEQRFRAFLAGTFPGLAEAAIVDSRCCLYCDTLDEHLWIDQHPEREGLTVASGGSGHGFKFAPLLGEMIADAVEGQPNQWLPRFQWRELDQGTAGEEAARYHDERQDAGQAETGEVGSA